MEKKKEMTLCGASAVQTSKAELATHFVVLLVLYLLLTLINLFM